MSIKKLAYYLEDADITLQSDHLPLKKFLAKNTLNSKVNNWVIEISPFHITFEYIKGIKNTLADTMSHLINIDPQIQLEPEQEGHEFGYYTFNSLPALEVQDIKMSSIGTTHNDDVDNFVGNLPINNSILAKLQQKDIRDGHLYKMDNKLLKRFIVDGNNTYKTTVIPRSLVPQVLQMVHDKLGHNETHRTYILLKRLYYWKGLKPSVEKHIKKMLSMPEKK